MIRRIPQIEGVGIFESARGCGRLPLGRVSLIYAGNGREKSTLATIFSSYASSDSRRLLDRKTIGSSKDAFVKFCFEGATGKSEIEFRNGSWTGVADPLRVFDGHFVEKNVHSSFEVTPSQRANLLSLALGENAVRELEIERQLSDEAAKNRDEIREVEAKLTAFGLGDISISQFAALPLDSNVENSIRSLEGKRIEIDRVATLRARARPAGYGIDLNFDTQKMIEVLNAAQVDLHTGAAAQVLEHVQRLSTPRAEVWLHQGHELGDSDKCPYCGQGVHGVELVEAFAVYFDAKYSEHIAAIDALRERVTVQLRNGLERQLPILRSQMRQMLAPWEEQLSIEACAFKSDLDSRIKSFVDSVDRLVQLKGSQPFVQVISADEAEYLKVAWVDICSDVMMESAYFQRCETQILGYVSSLDREDANQVDKELKRARLQRIRWTTEAQELVASWRKLTADADSLEARKQQARQAARVLVDANLQQYGDDVNKQLEKMGAEFSIVSLKNTFTRGTPRSDYAIEIRDQQVALKGTALSFGSALSEGDKRTMAFAFFYTSLLRDPKLSETVVVIDDPMTSLDTARRNYTIEVVKELSDKAGQVIVMAHDAVFLRDIKRVLGTKREDVAQLEIIRHGAHYSKFGEADLEELCYSVYLTNYATVSGFLDGKNSDAQQVNHAIRPLVEGYLYHKFPLACGYGRTLGAFLTQIENAETGDPLVSMQPHLSELRAVNEFGSNFHHDSSSAQVSNLHNVSLAETKAYARRALALVHAG